MWSRFVMSQVKHNSYFVVGMAVGLWLALALVPLEEAPAECAAAAPSPAADEFEPRREERPLGSGGAPAGRAVQRPRYYSTELGMRGSLLAGVLSSPEGLAERVPALNRSLARLQPALKFFVTASAAPHAPNVVGFTDTREMLRPFHALKYLADNYLEEYDFFFLVSDDAFVNARRLSELVSKLSVSQDIYMGSPASDDSQYCSLEAGVLLSNSVLRSVHAELEWCVRNSYSPAHHENLGRCVLHAAHVPCQRGAQGETYTALVGAGDVSAAELAAAVTARPVTAKDVPVLQARAARAALSAGAMETRSLRAALLRLAPHHPPGYRNASWPAGLRRDPGLAAPPPDNRFHHLRWTLLNATHAYMPDEVSAVSAHSTAHARALTAALAHARAWAERAWPAARAELVEAARQWEPAGALRYRLLLRLRASQGDTLRLVEVVRGLGAARLVPVRYVTESARVALALAVPGGAGAGGGGEAAEDALGFLERYEKLAQQDKNTQLYVVWVSEGGNETAPAALARAARARGAELLSAAAAPGSLSPGRPAPARAVSAGRAALSAVSARAGPHDVLLLTPPHAHFNQDALNRVRMNTIPGESWFLPQPFARHSQLAHPAFRATTGTGRFPTRPRAPLLAVHRDDLQLALESWTRAGGAADADPADVLAASSLRCVRAPEPGAVLAPRAAPCGLRAPPHDTACLRALADDNFQLLDLGQRNLLAQLLLETEAAV